MNLYENQTCQDIDLDYTISKNTLSYIETKLLEYKKKILKDLSENINVSYSELEKEFIFKEPKKKKELYRKKIDNTKCMARVWNKKLGPMQCSRNQSVNCFCKQHSTKLNYGRIDERIDKPI